MRSVIYARCSTEEDSQKDALANQIKEAKDCVERMGWLLVDIYIESRTGTTTKGRTEYNRLYTDLQKDLFDVIVIKSQDRLMRNTKDWYLFVDRLCANSKKLYIYIENKFYTADDALITGIKAILAEEYSRELSKKINNAHRNRQRNGGSVILTSNAYGFKKLPDKSVELIEEEARIKRRMYQLCADGFGSRTISNILADEKIRKRHGKNFTENDVLRIIRNPINMGTVVMNKQHFNFDSKQTERIPKEQQFRYENKVPATVSEELWVEANCAIDRRAAKAKHNGSSFRGSNPGKYKLSGKLFCGLCGNPYYRRFRKRYIDGSKIVEWRCKKYTFEGKSRENIPETGKPDKKPETKTEPGISGMQTGEKMMAEKGCGNIHLDEGKMFSLFEKVCAEYFSFDRDAVIRETLVLLQNVISEDRKEDKIQKLAVQEQRIKEQQDILLDKLLDGILPDEVCQRKQYALETTLKSCREKRKELENQTLKTISQKQRLKEIEKHLRDGDNIKRASVNEMLDGIEKIIVYPRYMEMFYNPEKKMEEGNINGFTQPEQKLCIVYGTMFDQMKQKQEKREQIVELIKGKPSITAKEIAKAMDCSLSGAQYKLKVLKKEGRIRFARKGGKRRWEVIE